MNYWLLKTEPEAFGYDDLVRLGKDRWNGVRNFTALKNIKQMQPGDRAFIYHTGKEKAIVGVAEIVTSSYPDPEFQDNRWMVVDVAPLYRLKNPVSLKTVKTSPAFTGWLLISQPRLSVMPVAEEHWKLVHDLSTDEYPFGI